MAVSEESFFTASARQEISCFRRVHKRVTVERSLQNKLYPAHDFRTHVSDIRYNSEWLFERLRLVRGSTTASARQRAELSGNTDIDLSVSRSSKTFSLQLSKPNYCKHYVFFFVNSVPSFKLITLEACIRVAKTVDISRTGSWKWKFRTKRMRKGLCIESWNSNGGQLRDEHVARIGKLGTHTKFGRNTCYERRSLGR